MTSSRWTRTPTATPLTTATPPAWGCRSARSESLTLSGVTLEPAFASDTVVYAASADHDVTSTRVTATLHNSSDTVSIMKGADTYMNGDSVPLEVGHERDHH